VRVLAAAVSLVALLVPGPARAAPAVPGQWRLVFADDFSTPGPFDRAKWTDTSSAEADCGHANPGNQQLEWNQAANAEQYRTPLGNGALRITARRQTTVSPCTGRRYGWTSALLTTRTFTFRYGLLEERAILPAARGFWPASWTWQAPGQQTWSEADGYEYFSDNPRRLYFTMHTGAGSGGCVWTPPFNPALGWHTYAVDVRPGGTRWYVDGRPVCRSAVTSAAPMSVITNMAVYAGVPPDPATTSATKRVDFIRVWVRD